MLPVSKVGSLEPQTAEQAPGWWSIIPLITWCMILFILSSIPGSEYPQVDWQYADKAVHLLLYTVLGICAASCFLRRGFPVYVPIAFGLFFGITDEIHQAWVPLRSPSVGDIYADAIGVTLGVTIFMCLRTWLNRRDVSHVLLAEDHNETVEFS